MKPIVLWAMIFAAISIAFADDATDREKLNGAWQSQGQGGGVWTLQAEGSSMHVANSQGDKKIVEFACELAKECEVKDAGKKVKVTVFFNGSKLVVMETRGDQVFKRRFGLSEKGDGLDLEMIPMVPDGKTETTHFTRVQTASAAAAKP